MEIVSQIGLKAQKICIKTTVIGIISLKTTNIYFFFKSWTLHMAAFYGQLPANFRFSGALAMAGAVLALVSKMVLETKPVSLLLNSVDQNTSYKPSNS